ncbi:hypothetical protein NDN08_001206 [Rhodosorus marinus]|uniref:SREBP regulating gene protein n=1 Tax=Rhodosorus marinus TaxID=101924 RepID=A0AAV8UUC0_9RHOD|nr:hypothetical protein NDN08_001206 [Rhodosorus marinus]
MAGMFLRRKQQKKSTIAVGIALVLIVTTITGLLQVPLLKHTSKEFVSEQSWQHASRLVRRSTAERGCKYVTSGPWLVADDQGYTCSTKNQDPATGCCPAEPPRYICAGCQRASHCCKHFEFCVSCCLSVSKESPSARLRNMERLKIYDLASSGTFEVCAVACKSHSGSLLHENAYRSPYHHCYGEEPPTTLEPQDGPTSGLFSFLTINSSN